MSILIQNHFISSTEQMHIHTQLTYSFYSQTTKIIYIKKTNMHRVALQTVKKKKKKSCTTVVRYDNYIHILWIKQGSVLFRFSYPFIFTTACNDLRGSHLSPPECSSCSVELRTKNIFVIDFFLYRCPMQPCGCLQRARHI